MNTDKLLTKSLYLNGLQCKKSLWLNKYNSEELKEPDDATKAIFKTGEKVGYKACELFPGGERISYDDTTSRSERIALTKQWIVDGVSTI